MKMRVLALFIALSACGGAAKPAPATVSTPKAEEKKTPPVATKADDAEDTAAEAQSAAFEGEMDAAAAQMAQQDERREAEQAAYAAAKPVFVKYCGACHTATGNKTSPKKLKHFDMSSYPFDGGAKIDEAISVTLGLRVNKPTMPIDKPGIVKGEELQLIETWAKAYHSTHLDREEQEQ